MDLHYEEYQQRRSALAKQLKPNSIAIIPAAKEILRNGDAHYRFRQDSNFWYLTGYNEPEALLVIIAGGKAESILFNRKKDAAREQWEGRRLGQQQAGAVLGVQQAFPIDEVKAHLLTMMSDADIIYYPQSAYPDWQSLITELLLTLKQSARKGMSAPSTMIDVEPLLSELRLFKSDAEISLLKKAARISAAAHIRAMQYCNSCENETQLEAHLCYEFNRNGCRAVAYQPIVGSGENSCILHYGDNDASLKKDALVLIDAGGEYGNYAADITRTFPVNGRYSDAQRTVYQWVLKAQQAGIACIKPGVRWDTVQHTMIKILVMGLLDMGILEGDMESLIESKAYLPYYMHNSGHWLGLDVHDCGAYKKDGQWRVFEPGMVLTVEPGLYLSSSLPGLDKRWHGIGVRIEDDILVTKDGHENLSADVPVEIDAIEALMRGRKAN